MFLVQAVYLIFATCVIFNYGSLLDQDVLVNIGKKYPIECLISTSKEQMKQKDGKLGYPKYYIHEKGTDGVYPENYVM